jgi:hypothetical protein
MPNTRTVDTLKKDPQHDRLTMAMTDLTAAGQGLPFRYMVDTVCV